jgi:hypothetical protein
MEGLARRGGTGRYKAGGIRRSGHPVQVGTIMVLIGVEDLDACQDDDMMWEIRDEEDVTIGQVDLCHEYLNVRARHSQNVTPGAFKVRCDSVLLMTLICGKVDEAAPHRSGSMVRCGEGLRQLETKCVFQEATGHKSRSCARSRHCFLMGWSCASNGGSWSGSGSK